MLSYESVTCAGQRDINEDAVGCFEYIGRRCFVVADGLGGHGHGEEASQELVRVFGRELEAPSKGCREYLERAFTAAQTAIMALQERKHARLDFKTTGAALALMDGKVTWAHCGDTRLYYFNGGKLQERTLDHSVPQMLVTAGQLKEKAISHHPDRNKLIRVVGVEWDSPRYETSPEREAGEGMAFLLCTDGYWEYLSNRFLERALKKSKHAGEWLEQLTTEVEKKGRGRDMDNYTALAVLL
jgi:serine/threonine protein phosphatase PrpC